MEYLPNRRIVILLEKKFKTLGIKPEPAYTVEAIDGQIQRFTQRFEIGEETAMLISGGEKYLPIRAVLCRNDHSRQLTKSDINKIQ